MTGKAKLHFILPLALILTAALLSPLTPLLQAQAPDARRTGEEVLYEALLGARDFLIVVPSNGCTRKESFQLEATRQTNPDGSIHYILSVKRKTPDECKRMPEREIIHFNLEKDLRIKGKFTYSLANRIFPAPAKENSLYTIIEKYFTVEPGSDHISPKPRPESTPARETAFDLAAAVKDEIEELGLKVRSELKQAMLYALEQEIIRYQKRSDQNKVSELKEQLKNFQAMADSEFPLPLEETEPTNQSFLHPDGPIIPPQVREARIKVSGRLKQGAILEVAGMTKSGPFYHLAGSRGDILAALKPGQTYDVCLLLIFKREYFGSIPNYYVYLAGLKEK